MGGEEGGGFEKVNAEGEGEGINLVVLIIAYR